MTKKKLEKMTKKPLGTFVLANYETAEGNSISDAGDINFIKVFADEKGHVRTRNLGDLDIIKAVYENFHDKKKYVILWEDHNKNGRRDFLRLYFFK